MNDKCKGCDSELGHKINCPFGIAFSKTPITYEFFGDDGYCCECKQPMEGASCPYCGWNDERPPQHKPGLPYIGEEKTDKGDTKW